MKTPKPSLISFLFLLFIGGYSTVVCAQNESELSDSALPKSRARQAIKDIKDGVLIIRLAGKSKKIQELERLAASDELDDATRRRLQKQAAANREAQKRFNINLTYAFSNHYRFSEVLFLYDTEMPQLLAGKQQGFFLDRNLRPDPSVSLNHRSFCLLTQGFAGTDGAAKDALLITDSRLEPLQPPFPYYVALNNFGTLIGSFLGSQNLNRRSAYKMARKFDKRFNKFYQQAEE